MTAPAADAEPDRRLQRLDKRHCDHGDRFRARAVFQGRPERPERVHGLRTGRNPDVRPSLRRALFGELRGGLTDRGRRRRRAKAGGVTESPATTVRGRLSPVWGSRPHPTPVILGPKRWSGSARRARRLAFQMMNRDSREPLPEPSPWMVVAVARRRPRPRCAGYHRPGCRGILGIEDLPDNRFRVRRRFALPKDRSRPTAANPPRPRQQRPAPRRLRRSRTRWMRPPIALPTSASTAPTPRPPPTRGAPTRAPTRGPDAPHDGTVEAEAGPAPAAKLGASQTVPRLRHRHPEPDRRQRPGSDHQRRQRAHRAAHHGDHRGCGFSILASTTAPAKTLGPSLSCTISIALNTTTAGSLVRQHHGQRHAPPTPPPSPSPPTSSPRAPSPSRPPPRPSPARRSGASKRARGRSSSATPG